MKKIYLMMTAALMIAAGGCAHKNESGKKAEREYQQARTDSITNVTARIDSCNEAAATLSDRVNELLRDFTAVNRSREVEGYTIYNGWQNRYPLQSTGVVARINASEGIELVAALSKGVFDRIRIQTPDASAETETVPNDQALNYRRDGLTTVMFSGEKAAEAAALVADNELNPVMVVFLNGGKETGRWKLPENYAKMISMTSLLYSTRTDQKKMEREAVVLGEKLKLLRRHQIEMKGDSTEQK